MKSTRQCLVYNSMRKLIEFLRAVAEVIQVDGYADRFKSPFC